MKIGFAVASSLSDKREMLFNIIRDVAVAHGHTAVALTMTEQTVDYIDVAVRCGYALNEKEVDFILTGCRSGLGMQLACNYIPNVICGYGTSEIEANLFASINQGNAFSYPFSLNWGWASEEKYRFVLHALFKGLNDLPYPKVPKETVQRKIAATDKLKKLKKTTQIDFEAFINVYQDIRN